MKRTNITCIVGALLFVIEPVAAQNAPLAPGVGETSQDVNQKGSFDTTPIEVKVASVVYRIPRNHMIRMGQAAALKLAWPGLNPLTKETQQCFGSILQGEQAGCASFEFMLRGSGNAGSGGRMLTNAEKVENFKKDFPNVTARRGPFGYDVYDLGPEDARIE